jgi:hypothetical protein
MDTVLRGLTNELCLVYLDDVIVIQRAPAQPAESISAVPKSPPNAQSGEVPTLSEHIVPSEAKTADPKNLKPLRYCPTPKNKYEIEASWTYACITDCLFPASPTLRNFWPNLRWRSKLLQKWRPPSKH